MANYTYNNLQDTNKCKKIKKQLENHLKRNPYDYDSALKYYNLGNYDNKLIIKIFNNFIYHKNREEVLFILGKAELAIGNIKEASYHFQTLLNENKSKWEDILFNEGKKELSINNLENASVYFNLLLSNDPKNLDDITFLIKNIKFLQENPQKTKKNLIKIRIKQKDYLSAINYLNYLNNSKLSFDLKAQVEILKLYLGKELNIFFKNGIKINFNYNNNQFLNYNASTAIKHIIDKHKNDFSDHINIYKLFKEIKEKLIKQQKISHLDINDIYDIPYQDVGNNCHILRVIVIPNTNNILTMFPLNANNFYLTDELSYNSNLKLQRKK